MWLALKNQLERNPCMSQQDMANFLFRQYQVKLSRCTIGRALKRAGWTKKATQNVAKEQSQDLRDDYIDRRSHYKLDQMIFVDESGSDRGLAILGRGYAPKGVTPKQTKRFHRGKRAQILPAYTIDGVIYCEVYEENTDTEVFEGFLERLLPFCGRISSRRQYLFGSVKNRIRKMSLKDEDLIQGDFKSYLLMQIRVVGGDRRIARGHFKKAQIDVDGA
ncbi:hypothetical protein CGGC5_v017186 [Colletotrichum fructicola Nara gc5]|uniref:Transposase n=1 Tax=Colletotrichum fructicola (strain Nara gc5) TaxID=1213859 RepID=A0A7J6IDP1_COLFN|nr:hypothetical protein CGGC5_v017186 [Colletotrichum fructicola Nara gc5]